MEASSPDTIVLTRPLPYGKGFRVVNIGKGGEQLPGLTNADTLALLNTQREHDASLKTTVARETLLDAEFRNGMSRVWKARYAPWPVRIYYRLRFAIGR
jgi:hypothetical protein